MDLIASAATLLIISAPLIGIALIVAIAARRIARRRAVGLHDRDPHTTHES